MKASNLNRGMPTEGDILDDLHQARHVNVLNASLLQSKEIADNGERISKYMQRWILRENILVHLYIAMSDYSGCRL